MGRITRYDDGFVAVVVPFPSVPCQVMRINAVPLSTVALKEAGLVIELDGVSHHFEATMEKDIRKQSYLESVGLKVLHFDDEEVMADMPNVLRVIEHALS